MTPSLQSCAAALLDVVPLIMRAVRTEVRRQRAPELSMPQFRALAFLGRNEGAALSDVAAFLGLSLPSASKLIDGLVGARFVLREAAPEDRRRVHLALTREGHDKYKAIVTQARNFLAGKVAHLDGPQRQQLHETLAVLRLTFEGGARPETSARRKRVPPVPRAGARNGKPSRHHV